MAELAYTYPTQGLSDPWTEVKLSATITTPSGESVPATGFYDGEDDYKIRYLATEIGRYDIAAQLSGPSGDQDEAAYFNVVPGSLPGLLRKHPDNPYRLIDEKDGSIFNGQGFNTCWNIDTQNPQHGELGNYIEAGDWRPLDEYFQTYAEAGFNIFRWNPGNCSFNIYNKELDKHQAAAQLLRSAKEHGFHVILTLFPAGGYQLMAPTDPKEAGRLKKRIDEVVSRYGPYVDMWEIVNESTPETASTAWLTYTVNYLRSIDPYQRLVMNSNPRVDDWKYLDARSPHYYDNYLNEYDRLANVTLDYTTAAAVVITEAGNRGMNWDPLSAARLRMRSWTAFIWGGQQVWWSATHAKDCNCNNIYLGEEERSYVRRLQTLVPLVDPSAQPAEIESSYTGSTFVRAYTLRSDQGLLVYAFRDPSASDAATVTFSIDAPFAGTAQWLDPASGETLGAIQLEAGPQQVTSPEFTQDMILLLTQ